GVWGWSRALLPCGPPGPRPGRRPAAACGPAGGGQHALLARVERVAHVAGLDVDHAVLGRTAGRERVAARAGDLGHLVLRVDAGLHRRWSFLMWSPGRPHAGVNRNLGRRTSVPWGTAAQRGRVAAHSAPGYSPGVVW